MSMTESQETLRPIFPTAACACCGVRVLIYRDLINEVLVDRCLQCDALLDGEFVSIDETELAALGYAVERPVKRSCATCTKGCGKRNTPPLSEAP